MYNNHNNKSGNSVNGGDSMNRSVGTSVVCYFCAETIQNVQLLQYHIKQCGSILEKCPNDCGAWIERRNRTSHTRQCRLAQTQNETIAKVQSHSSSTLPSRSSMGPAIYQVFENRQKDEKLAEMSGIVFKLQAEIENFKHVLCEERNLRDVLVEEMTKLRRQYNLSEERNQLAMATLTSLRKYVDEELEKQRRLIMDIGVEFNKINAKNQDVKEFIAQTELRVDTLEKKIQFEQNERSHMELILNSQNGKLRLINQLEEDVDLIKSDKSQIDLTRNEKIVTIQNELKELKALLNHENLQRKEQLQHLETVREEYGKSISEFRVQHEMIENDISMLRLKENGNDEKITTISNNLESLMKLVQNMQNDDKRVRLVPENNNIPRPEISAGHHLWRIDNYYEKVKDAIKNGTIYQSPIFLSHEYGYTLQAELNLNGVGRWQGRHLTVTVYLVPGEFDPILEWPVSLQADVMIKDQTPKKSESQDIVKSLVIKKKKDGGEDRRDEDSKSKDVKKQYIFVPHASLDKLDFIKNNTMFIFVTVSKQ